MDTFVNDKLREWRFESLEATFEEVETDREAFLQLNEGLLSILIPKVGGNKGQVSTPAVRTEV